MNATTMNAHVIQAPSRPHITIKPSIFLAGTTKPTPQGDWRQTLIDNTLAKHHITVFNPARPDWDSTWKEDFSDTRWADQIRWELDMQERADLVVVFFHNSTLAPISLLELGLCVKGGEAVVCVMPNYAKRGNVEAVCKRYNVPVVFSEEALGSAIEGKLMRHGNGATMREEKIHH